MRMMLHVFKKDVRRLWWAVGLTLVLLGTLARQDAWRSDSIPGSIEGWLNVIVPFAWACLLGLVVEQDPLVGDRQFWITRPHSRAMLLGAKLLFAAIFVHAASLAADCYILASRGFAPAQFLPQLLWKQVMLAAALTLPSLALAALFRNFTQFMVGALAVVVTIVVLSGTYQLRPFMQFPSDEARTAVVVLLVCGAAAAIILLQYLGRKTMGARAFGIVAASLAAAAYSWLPVTTLWAARSRTDGPRGTVSAHLEAGPVAPPIARVGHPINTQTVYLPVALSGVPAGERSRMLQLELEIESAAGERHEWHLPVRGRTFQKPDFNLFNLSSRDQTIWLQVQMDLRLYQRLNQGPVTIRGKSGVTLSRMGSPATVPAVGSSAVLGRYRCTGFPREDSWHQAQVKFECESPAGIPPYVWTELAVPGLSPNWKQVLGDSSIFVPYASETWLSPLNRRQTFINLTSFRGGLLESLASPEVLANSKVTVTPEFVTGYSLVNFELKNARLSDYTYTTSPAKP
jgi:hypothetical protein